MLNSMVDFPGDFFHDNSDRQESKILLRLRMSRQVFGWAKDPGILKLPKTALCLLLLQTQGNRFPRSSRSLFYRSITRLSAVGASVTDCLYIRSDVGKWGLSDWPREAWHRYIFPSGALRICSKDCQRNHQGRCFKTRFFSSKVHHRAEAQLPKTGPLCSVIVFSAVSSSASSPLASVVPHGWYSTS